MANEFDKGLKKAFAKEFEKLIKIQSELDRIRKFRKSLSEQFLHIAEELEEGTRSVKEARRLINDLRKASEEDREKEKQLIKEEEKEIKKVNKVLEQVLPRGFHKH